MELAKRGDLSGTIDWLVRGFALEQAQYVVESHNLAKVLKYYRDKLAQQV